MDKKEFRKYAKNIRQNVINTQEKTNCILKNLVVLEEYQNAKTIFSYMSIQTEVSTTCINKHILDEKKTLALPKVYDKSMEFKKVLNLAVDTEKGSFNVLEPIENLPVVDNFDVILVPAVAFCKRGYRMGYGAGFYDKYLCNKRGKFIGICFDEQIFDSIPIDEFDVKMDILVTPTQIIRL